eukprot:scaffold11019_cov75-Phaeocystis_antarctica.AAC.7
MALFRFSYSFMQQRTSAANHGAVSSGTAAWPPALASAQNSRAASSRRPASRSDGRRRPTARSPVAAAPSAPSR